MIKLIRSKSNTAKLKYKSVTELQGTKRHITFERLTLVPQRITLLLINN